MATETMNKARVAWMHTPASFGAEILRPGTAPTQIVRLRGEGMRTRFSMHIDGKWVSMGEISDYWTMDDIRYGDYMNNRIAFEGMVLRFATNDRISQDNARTLAANAER